MINNTISCLVETIYNTWKSSGLDGDFPGGLWYHRAPSADLLITEEPPAKQWEPYVVFDVEAATRKQFTSALRGICQYRVAMKAYLGEGISVARHLMERLNNVFQAGLRHVPDEPTYYVLSVLEAEPSSLVVDKDLKLGKDVLVGKIVWDLLVNEEKELVNIN